MSTKSYSELELELTSLIVEILPKLKENSEYFDARKDSQALVLALEKKYPQLKKSHFDWYFMDESHRVSDVYEHFKRFDEQRYTLQSLTSKLGFLVSQYLDA